MVLTLEVGQLAMKIRLIWVEGDCKNVIDYVMDTSKSASCFDEIIPKVACFESFIGNWTPRECNNLAHEISCLLCPKAAKLL